MFLLKFLFEEEKFLSVLSLLFCEFFEWFWKGSAGRWKEKGFWRNWFLNWAGNGKNNWPVVVVSGKGGINHQHYFTKSNLLYLFIWIWSHFWGSHRSILFFKLTNLNRRKNQENYSKDQNCLFRGFLATCIGRWNHLTHSQIKSLPQKLRTDIHIPCR